MIKYSQHLQLVNHLDVIRENITRYRKQHDGTVRFLEVGSGDNPRSGLAQGFQYTSLDVSTEAHIKCNICIPLDRAIVQANLYDIVFSYNMIEHTEQPFYAAHNCTQLAKPGGLVIAVAPFSWRYHPFPIDMWRFTHSGLAHLFERGGDVERVIAAYDINARRKDSRGVRDDGLDMPPIDVLGGWRENWLVVYVGRKVDRA